MIAVIAVLVAALGIAAGYAVRQRTSLKGCAVRIERLLTENRRLRADNKNLARKNKDLRVENEAHERNLEMLIVEINKST